MVALPHPEESMADRVYAAILKDQKRQFRLSRLGASSIGDECLRSLFYSWRGYDEDAIDGRLARLFETGHREEERIIADLRRAGFSVWDKDDRGDQFTYTDESGHFVVKVDGIIKGVPGAEKTSHVLEIKTHNRNSFDDLVKKGVQAAKPMHYYQMQAGMMFSKIDRALYVALCKDNENYHFERIRPDVAIQNKIYEKIEKLIAAEYTPAGISETASSYGCKFCNFKAVCIGDKAPKVTCRSCQFSEPGRAGAWVCSLYNKTLSLTEQREACYSYSVAGNYKIKVSGAPNGDSV